MVTEATIAAVDVGAHDAAAPHIDADTFLGRQFRHERAVLAQPLRQACVHVACPCFGIGEVAALLHPEQAADREWYTCLAVAAVPCLAPCCVLYQAQEMHKRYGLPFSLAQSVLCR